MNDLSQTAGDFANPDVPVILIADDDPVMLQSVADLLRLAGYRILTATNGAVAWQVLQDQTPDLIIADITMPVMDGYQLYDAVRGDPQWSLVPFMFLTARGEEKDIRYGYRLGADHYVTKPFEPDDLLAVVEARLKRMQIIRSAVSSNIEDVKRRLVNTFSHELRTPLTSIYGFVSLLQSDLEELADDQVREMLDHIEIGARRLSRLTEDLLLMIQIDSGAVKAEIERFGRPVNMKPIINDVAARLSDQARERHTEIDVRVDEALPTQGISSRLADIVTRLVDNAIKFSRPDGEPILITGSRRDDTIYVAVEDRGIGIPSNRQQQLFQRFEQINREKTEQQGTGVGLVIALELARLHGGTIEARSREGIGSSFTLVLPAA
ncbi:MAG: hybrid sensor histidine kinase/response regulator [Anaerolineae bacterium]|nr:hybrid sensor histidine kinase/response regulator [Anaerolineae bacterium]